MSGIEGSAPTGADGAHRGNRAAAVQAKTKIGPRAQSPYTVKNLDDAITHLEVAIAADSSMAIFGRRYWRDRVQQIGSTPGILPAQTRRLRDLSERLSCAA